MRIKTILGALGVAGLLCSAIPADAHPMYHRHPMMHHYHHHMMMHRYHHRMMHRYHDRMMHHGYR